MGSSDGTTVANTPRFFISDSSDHKYVLPSDDKEKQRLDTQSKAVNELFDNKLIWAPAELKAGDIVLDSGTGSGHWLLSLSKEIPSTINLIGIDISTRMFPPPEIRPPNTTFTELSITALPPAWKNTITLIHQRLLLVALQIPQWQLAISSMYQSLVPGGYVQLFEAKHTLVSPNQEIHRHKARAIRTKMLGEITKIPLDVISHIPQWLEQAGFVDLKVETRSLPLGSWGGELGKAGLKATLGFYDAMKERVMKEGLGLGLVETGEEYDELVRDLEKKCDETPGTYFEYWAFVARKPLA